MIEVEVGQGKDNFQVTSGEVIEVAVDQDQVLQQVPIEKELDVSSVGNTTTLPKIVKTCQTEKDQTEQMLDSEEHESIESSCCRHLQKFG